MENPLESIHTVVEKLAESYDPIMAKFLKLETEDGICFDLSEVIPNIDRPLLDLQMRMAAVLGLLKGLPKKADVSVVPDTFFRKLLTELDAAWSTLDQIDQAITKIETNGGVATIEKDALVVVQFSGDPPRNEFGPLFKNM